MGGNFSTDIVLVFLRILPFFIPLLVGIAVRIIDHFWKDDDKDLFVYLAVLSNVGSILLLWPHYFVLILVLAISALFILTAHHYYQSRGMEVSDLVSYFLFITFGLILALATPNLLFVFSGLFIISVSATYLLKGYGGKDMAKKFWIISLASDLIFLFGAVFYFGSVGTFNVISQPDLGQTINEVAYSGKFFIISISFILTAFLLKIAAFPFHWWVLDVMKLRSTPLLNLLIIFVRGAVVFVMFKVLSPLAPMWGDYFSTALIIVAILTMTWANISALKSRDAITLLAHSSIASVGYILALFVALTGETSQARLSIALLTVVFMFAHLGAYSVVQMISADKDEGEGFSAFDGLGARQPWIALAFSLFLAALAGFPPLLGFVAKYAAIATLAATGDYFLLAVFAVNIVISIYCYMRPITRVYFFRSNEKAVSGLDIEYPLIVVVIVAAVVLLYLGLMPSSLIAWLL